MASIAIVLFATDNCLYGQSTTDNNIGFGGKYLGYSNNLIPLWLRTNNTTRMTITGGFGANSGRVGIGTTNPQMPLEVRGSGLMNMSWRRGIMLSNPGTLS